MNSLETLSPTAELKIFTILICLLLFSIPLRAGIITVNTNADNNTADSFLSLREAILLANNSTTGLGRSLTGGEASQISGSVGADFTDEIRFAGTYIITITDTLPRMTDANTTINGYSAPSSVLSTTPATSLLGGLNNVIRIRVAGNGAVDDGIRIQANGCVVRGLSITSFNNAGVIWMAPGNKTSGKLEGCYLGISTTGVPLANGYGVVIESNNSNIKIGGTTPDARNLISGNIYAGIFFNGGDNCTVMGNFIGADLNGMSDLGNGTDGILLDGYSVNDTIGGQLVSQRNVISGNDNYGINISFEGCDYTVIKNNFIGLARDGVGNLKNTSNGIRVDGGADNTLIGGDWDHNYICYNSIGIYLNAASTTLTTISMNYIGFTINGNAAGNIGNGIHLDQAVTSTIGPKNRIGNNSESGITIIASDATVIKGNYIGTDSSALSPDFGNGLNGISLIGAAANNLVGGGIPADRNIIVYNDNYGIEISEGSAANTVTNNYIGINNTGIDSAGNGAAGVGIINGNVNTIGPNNVISANRGCGVLIFGIGCKDNIVKGNLIGTNSTGNTARPNWLDGVRIENINEPDAHSNTIGGDIPADRNVISGNRLHGVRLRGPFVKLNTIKGNYIGLASGGGVVLKNDSCGIRLERGAPDNVIGSSTLLGTGNVIAGNGLDGILIDASPKTEIYGNVIGLNNVGNGAIANGGAGIHLEHVSTQTIIGKNTNAARNIISGNTDDGIIIETGSTANIYNNYIGTNLAGTNSIANGGSGIVLLSDNNQIGAESAGYRNIIAGNSDDGITIAGDGSSDNKIFDNWIGQSSSGTVVANGGVGIFIGDSVYNTIVGGTTGTMPNVIRGNLGRGVYLGAGARSGNLISGNSIYENGGLGIDLFDVGVNPNDNNDVDSGPNRLMNFPTFTYGNYDVASKTLTCRVRHNASTANQKYPVTVQFFTGGVDGSGYGEGQTYLGKGIITAPNTTTTIDMTNIASRPATITAIAIDADNNTSEFSANYLVTVPVELSIVTARLIDDTVHLSWKTESELNNFGFEIERTEDRRQETENGSVEWEKIGFVSGHGTTYFTQDYSFTDDLRSQIESTSGGRKSKITYRLKQIDYDGSFTYSSIVSVDLNSEMQFQLSQNYPNPFSLRTGSTNISFTIPVGQESLPVRLLVYDNFGRAIKTLVDSKLSTGMYVIRMDGQRLESGVYYYRLDVGTKTEVRKMVVVK